MQVGGATVARVDEGSIAHRLGIRPGDVILEVNGRAPRDILEFMFLTAEDAVEMRVTSRGRELVFKVAKSGDEDIGVHFASGLFDGMKKCENRCIFCFVDQLPPGLRESLYVKDDDYRLSFTNGNYITLTNVGPEDMQRIKSLRLSPLYISVHATDPAVRRFMLRNGRAGRIREQLHELASASIRFHCQVVVCPGVNDGEILEKTIADLGAFWPWAVSLAVVPVGLTGYRHGLPQLRPLGSGAARAVVVCVERWQRRFRRALGSRFVHAADEFYIASGIPFPPAVAYEGFPQLEDGIGLGRQFLTEWSSVARRLPTHADNPLRVGLVTGEAAAPILERAAVDLRRVRGLEAHVVAVPSDFLGPSITVSGLLSGRDLARRLGRDAASFDVFLVPRHALGQQEAFVDGMALDELRTAVGCPVLAVEPRARSLFCVARELILGKGQGGMLGATGRRHSRQTQCRKVHAL